MFLQSYRPVLEKSILRKMISPKETHIRERIYEWTTNFDYLNDLSDGRVMKQLYYLIIETGHG